MKLPVLLLFTLFNLVSFAQNNSLIWVKGVDSCMIEVSDSNQMCHSSSILQLDENNFLIVWFEGLYEGAAGVKIMYSRLIASNGKLVKTKPDVLAFNDSFACWNPVLQRINKNEIVLFYKIGKNPREWTGFYKKSLDNGLTWGNENSLPTSFIGPVKNKGLMISDTLLICPSSTESMDNKWNIHLEYYHVLKNDWRKISLPNDTFGLIQPSILQYGMDTLQLLCRSRQNKIIQLWSYDKGKNWTIPAMTNLPNPNSGIDAVDWKDGIKLLVYNPMIAGKEWWEGRAELRLAMSKNGSDWVDIMILEKHDKGEYSYPSIICTSSNEILISYTYNRKGIMFKKLKIDKT